MAKKKASKKKTTKKAAPQRRGTSAVKKKPKGFQKGNPYRWKPGQSGNPRGPMKKEESILQLVNDIKEWPVPRVPRNVPRELRDPANWSFARVVAWKLWTLASQGDLRAIDMVINRLEGRLPLPVAFSPPPPAEGDGPGLRIEVVDSRKGPETKNELPTSREDNGEGALETVKLRSSTVTRVKGAE